MSLDRLDHDKKQKQVVIIGAGAAGMVSHLEYLQLRIFCGG